MDNIEIRLLTPQDKNVALEFLKNRARIDGAPLMSCLELGADEAGLIGVSMIEDALKDQKYCSFLALDKTSCRVVGCVLRAVLDRWPGPEEEVLKSDFPKSDELQSLIDFNRLMWSGFREFVPIPYVGPILKSDIGLVDPAYRRSGLYRRMVGMALERARSNFGCRYSIGLFTSFKSQAYVQTQGWQTLRWIKYEDYYVQGKLVFDMPKKDPQQVDAKLMMIDIDEWLESSKTAD